MKRTTWLWLIAFIVTLLAARYQRMTGPGYPVYGRSRLGSAAFSWKLERTHAGPGDHRVHLKPRDPAVFGLLEWKRYPTSDAWTVAPMRREGETLIAELPHQPPAGKLAYRVTLMRGAERIVIPERGPAVIRFRGAVPIWILVPHIVAMFTAMLLSTRAGLECFHSQPRFGRLVGWTLGVLAVGGLVFGALVQKFAFGALWTGFPVGTDLTDNKTLIALLGWIAAAIAVRRLRNPGGVVVAAALLMLAVYSIPHSLRGSELDYGRLDAHGAPAHRGGS